MHSGARCSARTICDGCKCHPNNCNLQRLLVAKACRPCIGIVPMTNLLCDMAIVSPRTGHISARGRSGSDAPHSHGVNIRLNSLVLVALWNSYRPYQYLALRLQIVNGKETMSQGPGLSALAALIPFEKSFRFNHHLWGRQGLLEVMQSL